MSDILNKATVLVLNRNWQAIHVKTPAEAFCMLATGAGTSLDVLGDDHIVPVRVPTVIVAANYSKVPFRRPNPWLRPPGRESLVFLRLPTWKSAPRRRNVQRSLECTPNVVGAYAACRRLDDHAAAGLDERG